MAETLQTLIHTWDLIEEHRDEIALVGAIRLDPADNLIKLRADSNGNYPLTGEHYAITPLFSPGAVRQWVGFQADIAHVVDGVLGQLTGEAFRLHDGETQWYWDGAAWVETGTAWNTQAEIANNISSFSATARALRIVIRLSTTDKTKTPLLARAKVAWTGRVFWMEDLMYRSLHRYLSDIRLSVDLAVKVPFPGGASFELGPILDKLGIPFNIVTIEAAFNEASDPDSVTDILTSYNETTRRVTLTSAVPVGDFVRFRMVVSPEVAIENTASDYIEVERVPAIQATDFEDVASSPLSQDDSVVNKATHDLIRLPAPYRFDVRFSMIALAPSSVDLTRLIAAIVEYMERNPILRSVATDRPYTIQMIDEFNVQTRPSLSNLANSRASAVIKNVLAFNKPAVYEKGVTSLNLGGDLDATVT